MENSEFFFFHVLKELAFKKKNLFLHQKYA